MNRANRELRRKEEILNMSKRSQSRGKSVGATNADDARAQTMPQIGLVRPGTGGGRQSPTMASMGGSAGMKRPGTSKERKAAA